MYMHLPYNNTSYVLYAYGPLTIADIDSLLFKIHFLHLMMCIHTLM